ncbi:MAG: competence protein ComFB [Gammaproteobacteria bacterium]|nr:competence protein ComFB [Gammaproteobacteria bacterium]
MSIFRSFSSFDLPSHFEEVANYYERLVVERLMELKETFNSDQLADVACIALNQLPSWYIRNHVDAHFYLSESQLAEMHLNTENAVLFAIEKVTASPRE